MLLEITDLAVEVSGREILTDVDLYIDKGETHVLLGPNGSGKSTLFMTLLGFPKYNVTRGEIIFKGEDITNFSTTERVRRGFGVSFQNPPSIRGVKLGDLLKIEHGESDTGEGLSSEMMETVHKLKFDEKFLERDVNLGFSGGEVKRSEILQLLAQEPDFIMFDEPDSGVDIENVEILAEEINNLLDKKKKPGLREKSGLLITHLGYILNFVAADTAHVLLDGKIACSGNPNEIMEDIRKEGFKGCVECCKIQ
ncbi:MAG: Fe-S cluster assembly ATPase SufC [Methanobacterium sp.]|nr:Fe-S cluster assembly ATPase SufC [Methanobacterium sp.]